MDQRKVRKEKGRRSRKGVVPEGPAWNRGTVPLAHIVLSYRHGVSLSLIKESDGRLRVWHFPDETIVTYQGAAI